MVHPVEEKIKEFSDRLEKEDITVVIPELITYLEGIRDTDPDPLRRELYSGFMITLHLAKVMMELRKNIIIENDKMKSQHNNLLGRFNELEKKFNDEIARK